MLFKDGIFLWAWSSYIAPSCEMTDCPVNTSSKQFILLFVQFVFSLIYLNCLEKPIDDLFSVSFESGRYKEERVWTGMSSTLKGVWPALRYLQSRGNLCPCIIFLDLFCQLSSRESHSWVLKFVLTAQVVSVLLPLFFLQLDHNSFIAQGPRLVLFLLPSLTLPSALEAARILIYLAKGTYPPDSWTWKEEFLFTLCSLETGSGGWKPVIALTWERVQAAGKPSSGSWKVCSVLSGTTTTIWRSERVQQTLIILLYAEDILNYLDRFSFIKRTLDSNCRSATYLGRLPNPSMTQFPLP